MATREKKTEGSNKTTKKSSASTPGQKSKQDAKGTGNDPDFKSFIEEFKKFQQQLDTAFNTMFKKQDQTSEDLRKFLNNVNQRDVQSARDESRNERKGPDDEDQKYVIFRNAYFNLAQRNKSRENVVHVEVKVDKAYTKALADLENKINITTKTN